MAGGIDEVELVLLAVLLRGVIQRDRMRLDGDAALALQIHGIEHLRLHLAVFEAAANLDEAVCQRRLAVVNVGDDGEVADVLDIGHSGSARMFLQGAHSVSRGSSSLTP